MDAAHGIDASSVVTAIARNGVTTAIRVSGLGRQWFEAASDMPVGLFFPGFRQEDANADLGDSAICETAGFGGSSLAASPGARPARRWHRRRGDRVFAGRCTTSPSHAIPASRCPRSISPARRAASTSAKSSTPAFARSSPQGIAHREAGVGQIGAGIVRAPMACFTQAVIALAAALGVSA